MELARKFTDNGTRHFDLTTVTEVRAKVDGLTDLDDLGGLTGPLAQRVSATQLGTTGGR